MTGIYKLAVIFKNRIAKMKYIYILTIIFFISCSSKQNKNGNNYTRQAIDNSKTVDTTIQKTEIIETFIDSTNIGVKGESKIEIIKHRVFDDIYVIVKFFRKSRNQWFTQNTYLYESTDLISLDPNISDFNNDKLNDITFISSRAARMANEVRRLFIYDENERELVSIINSQDYPNMLYNKELNCIDAFLVYGGSSTVFARIKKDSLVEFASVNNSDCRTVYEKDKNGKEILLQKDTIIDGEGVYMRYENYKPLKPYKE
jgi:hypothetical protein